MEFSMTASGGASLFWPGHLCGMRHACATYPKSFTECRSTWRPESKNHLLFFLVL